jgi:hypothetical protein
MPMLLPYPEWLPFKTVAAAAGLILLPTVSRLTQDYSPARPLTTGSGIRDQGSEKR